MLIHSVWARIAVTFKQERVLRSFHRFSVHVWALWMAALVSGIVLVAALSPGLSPGTEQCKKADSQLSLSLSACCQQLGSLTTTGSQLHLSSDGTSPRSHQMSRLATLGDDLEPGRASRSHRSGYPVPPQNVLHSACLADAEPTPQPKRVQPQRRSICATGWAPAASERPGSDPRQLKSADDKADSPRASRGGSGVVP
jgi:hypothetical protein